MTVQRVVAPFGKWESPITVDLLTGAALSFASLKAVGTDDLYFLESRPFEGGRSVLVKMDGQGKMTDVVGKTVNVRTKVHEYGGGGYVVDADRGIVYSEFKDSRLYHIPDLTKLDNVVPLTAEGTPLRFAAFTYHPTLPLLVAVCEDHTHPEPANVQTYLVLINLEDKSLKTIVSGADFYSTPTFSPDGNHLAWQEWMHPEMPWTCSSLYIAPFDQSSTTIGSGQKLAGGTKAKASSTAQPRFCKSGTLVYASDETGYTQLYKSETPYTSTSALTAPFKGEFTDPDWVFDIQTYTIVHDKKQVITRIRNSKASTLLGRIKLDDGDLEQLDHPFLTIDAIQSSPAYPELVYIEGSTRTAAGIFSFNVDNGDLKLLKAVVESDKVKPEFLSLPQPLEIPLSEGGNTYGFYYAPTSPTHQGPKDALPPLLMRIHGGPTSFSEPVASLAISYWTSRGYAFFNLNYGGSSGYGREYVSRLDGLWGVVDSRDAIESAKWFAANKYCDGSKMAIDGGSAGGFTTLNVLCHSTVFAAGCSLFGVAEVKALAEETHKFESQYLYNLIGGTPEEVPDNYHDRSALYFAKNIKNPIMIQQGTEDRVVPINQAEMMVKEIKEAGGEVEFLVLEGEGHGFRGEKAKRLSLQGETDFFDKALKL